MQATRSFEIPCNESTSTVKVVDRCPTTESEFKKAAERKNCTAIPNTCKSFYYHCVLDMYATELVEVCAPMLLVVGKFPGFFLKIRYCIMLVHDCISLIVDLFSPFVIVCN